MSELTEAEKAAIQNARSKADRLARTDPLYAVVDDLIAAREKALAEKIAQEIHDAFPLPGEIEAICTAGHDCHAAARYTTGRMAARIAREVTS